ncbi:MAG: N-acetylglucosamine-6-phosphate deacetylase [Pedosphaera sp.]|nr:N-acetylglucosamine-6-phosphate deacetylase [Pedosphaera sp.]
METGDLSAWYLPTRQPMRVRWSKGVITHFEPAGTPPPPAGLWLAPPLLDVQVNGYAGVDFQQDNLTVDDLLRAARALRADGCATFLLTLITDDWFNLTGRLRQLVSLRAQSEELKSAIAGWHIEGPFLSTEPGFHGAHDPALMRDPKPEHIYELRALAGRDPVLLTLAPERRGALDVIPLAVSCDMKVSLGHTNASAEILAQAVRAGATMFTHLGNGCPRELDRHDNILWRVIETPGLTVSLIPDQIHVSPPLFRLLHRSLGPERIFYTTDAMAAAGAKVGKYTIGKVQVEVGSDQIVRQPGKTNFAGSALKPSDGVFRAAAMLNCPWQEVWLRYSQTPERLLGRHRTLAAGERATFCVVRGIEGRDWREVQPYWNG